MRVDHVGIEQSASRSGSAATTRARTRSARRFRGRERGPAAPTMRTPASSEGREPGARIDVRCPGRGARRRAAGRGPARRRAPPSRTGRPGGSHRGSTGVEGAAVVEADPSHAGWNMCQSVGLAAIARRSVRPSAARARRRPGSRRCLDLERLLDPDLLHPRRACRRGRRPGRARAERQERGPAGTRRVAPNISTSVPRPVRSRSATSATIQFSDRSCLSCCPTCPSFVSATIRMPAPRGGAGTGRTGGAA